MVIYQHWFLEFKPHELPGASRDAVPFKHAGSSHLKKLNSSSVPKIRSGGSVFLSNNIA
jgi:hypothetical protein